jgi:hypothetical protein
MSKKPIKSQIGRRNGGVSAGWPQAGRVRLEGICTAVERMTMTYRQQSPATPTSKRPIITSIEPHGDVYIVWEDPDVLAAVAAARTVARGSAAAANGSDLDIKLWHVLAGKGLTPADIKSFMSFVQGVSDGA